MEYLEPTALGKKMVDSGVAKLRMAPRDSFIRAYMAGALLGLGAAFAVNATIVSGSTLVGGILFPLGGFCALYLMGFDLITGLFVLTPLAWLDGRQGVTIWRILKNWVLVFFGNFAGGLTTATLLAIVFTYGFSADAGPVGTKLAGIGESRVIGYAQHGAAGWLTIFIRGCLCNWMVSLGVVGAMMSTTVTGKVIAMWMPIMVFFSMGFEHSVVNMMLFPLAIMMGGNFSFADYLFWNEVPTAVGNMVGGITLTGLTVYTTHVKTAPEHVL